MSGEYRRKLNYQISGGIFSAASTAIFAIFWFPAVVARVFLPLFCDLLVFCRSHLAVSTPKFSDFLVFCRSHQAASTTNLKISCFSAVVTWLFLPPIYRFLDFLP